MVASFRRLCDAIRANQTPEWITLTIENDEECNQVGEALKDNWSVKCIQILARHAVTRLSDWVIKFVRASSSLQV